MSYPEVPNGLPPNGQNEALVTPRPEAISAYAGAAALTGEACGQEPGIGELTLSQIRGMFRKSDIPTSRGVQRPPIIQEHPDEHQSMVAIISDWRDQYALEDITADQVAHRMSTTWVKVAAALQKPDLMTEEDRLRSTLNVFYGDAVRAVSDLKLGKNGVRVALYNSRDELRQAKELAERSPLLRPSDFKACAAAAPANVLGRTRQTQANVKAIVWALNQRTLAPHPAITKSIISRVALRNPTAEDCIAAVRGYTLQIDKLTAKYKNNPLVTPERIRLVCSTKSNPERIIENILDLAESLTAQFKGRYGLTEYDIVNVVFRSKNPKKKLEDTIEAIPNTQTELGNRLTSAKVRELVLTTSDPVNEGRNILKRADMLKVAFAGNTEVQQVFSDRDFVRFAEEGVDAQDVANFAHSVVVARHHFANNPDATESIIRRASRIPGDVIQNTSNLVATARRLAASYGAQNVPTAVIDMATAESSDPDRYIQNFLRIRYDATRQFGGRLTRGTINNACIRIADPIEQLGKRMAAYNRLRQDPTMAHVSDRDLMRRVSREPVDDRLKAYNANTIIADMQRLSREHRRGGSRAHVDMNYEAHLELIKSHLTEWVDDFIPINHGIDQDKVIERFTRMYYNYIRYGKDLDLIDDTQMLCAVFEDYCNYVRELAQHGFNNPEAVAQFNTRYRILGHSSERTLAMRQASNAGNYGSLYGDRELGYRLRMLYRGEVDYKFQDRLDSLISAERALIEYRLHGRRNKAQEQYLREQLRTDDLDTYYDDLIHYLQLRNN